jgi:hypothetical protein
VVSFGSDDTLRPFESVSVCGLQYRPPYPDSRRQRETTETSQAPLSNQSQHAPAQPVSEPHSVYGKGPKQTGTSTSRDSRIRSPKYSATGLPETPVPSDRKAELLALINNRDPEEVQKSFAAMRKRVFE